MFLTNSDPTMFAPLNAYYHYPPNVYYAQCTAQCILCSMHFISIHPMNIMLNAPLNAYYAQCTTQCILCSMHIIIIHPMYIMPNAYYHYPPNAYYAQCTAQCILSLSTQCNRMLFSPERKSRRNRQWPDGSKLRGRIESPALFFICF